MARIEWQPLAIPDIGESAIRAQQLAGTSIQNAFNGITGVIDQWEGSQREKALAELYARQNAFAATNDVAGYTAALADGNLTRGLNYLRASDLAAARNYTGELRTGRNAEFSYGRGVVEAGRSDRNDARSETDLTTGVLVAREANRIRAAVQSGQMTEAQGVEAAAALAAQTNNAAQINNAFGSVEQGVEGSRRNARWRWEGEGQDRARQTWNWQVQDRETEEQASALALRFQEYGPNATNDDLIASAEYQRMAPRVRARALAMLGREAPSADVAAGAPAGSFSENASWAERIGLVNSESGGNLAALNNEGYGGRLQFGADRLADAARAGIVPAGMTGAQFSRQSAEVQRRVEDWHFADIDRQASRRGLNQYIGTTVGGVPINQNSIRAMAHLGGIAGVEEFIRTNGRVNPADSNGTRLSDYGARFGRVPVTPANAQAQAQTIRVAAGVAAGTDRFGPLARNVIPLLNDDRDPMTVANELTATEGGRFASLNAGQVARRIRSVQEQAREQGIPRLSSAAAAQIIANNLDPYSVGDFFGGFVGRRGSIQGRNGGLAQSINLAGVREDLAQLRAQPVRGPDGRAVVNPDGSVQTEIPLATHFRNQSNREQASASAEAGAAALAAARAAYDQQVALDARRGITNNPVTARIHQQYMALSEQWGGFLSGAVDQLAGTQRFAAPPPPRPVARGPAGSATPVRSPRTVVYGD